MLIVSVLAKTPTFRFVLRVNLQTSIPPRVADNVSRLLHPLLQQGALTTYSGIVPTVPPPVKMVNHQQYRLPDVVVVVVVLNKHVPQRKLLNVFSRHLNVLPLSTLLSSPLVIVVAVAILLLLPAHLCAQTLKFVSDKVMPPPLASPNLLVRSDLF